jgi:hypothetical protein
MASRKQAALARLKFHRGVTPPGEVRAMQAQYRIDRDERRATLDEIEALKAKLKDEPKIKKQKPTVKAQKKPKVEKAEVAKKDEYTKDFYEGDDD